jgi:hypothetical protein
MKGKYNSPSGKNNGFGEGLFAMSFLLMQTLLPQAPATASTRSTGLPFLFLLPLLFFYFFLFFFLSFFLFLFFASSLSFFFFLAIFLFFYLLSFLPSFIYFCSPFARARGKE